MRHRSEEERDEPSRFEHCKVGDPLAPRFFHCWYGQLPDQDVGRRCLDPKHLLTSTGWTSHRLREGPRRGLRRATGLPWAACRACRLPRRRRGWRRWWTARLGSDAKGSWERGRSELYCRRVVVPARARSACGFAHSLETLVNVCKPAEKSYARAAWKSWVNTSIRLSRPGRKTALRVLCPCGLKGYGDCFPGYGSWMSFKMFSEGYTIA